MILSCIEKLVDAWFAVLPRPRPDAAQAANARLIAHRGAHDHSLNIIENSDAAFERAASLGCWGIEFDVHACADDVLVVNHDPTLNRLWQQNITISTSNFEEIRAAAPSVPTLKEVVARYGKKMHLFIELKAPFTAEEALAEALQPLVPCVDYHLLSLDETLFPRLGLFPGASLLLVPVHNNVAKFCNLSLKNHYGGVLAHYFLLRNQQIQALRAENQMVGVGFVDSKYSLYRELNRGLQYFFSNNVAAVSAVLRDLKK